MADPDQSTAAPEAAAPESVRAPGGGESLRLPGSTPMRGVAGAGNAALARFASSGSGLPAGPASQALLQGLGGSGASNASLARLAGPARAGAPGPVIAREDPPGAAPAPAADPNAQATDSDAAVKSKRTGPQPKFQLPGVGSILDVGLPHDKSVHHEWAASFNSGQKSLGIKVPLGPLDGEIGGSIGGAFDAKGGADVTWTREKGSASPVGDRIDVNANMTGKGRASAAVYANVGKDLNLVKAVVGGYGQLTVQGDGAAKVKGAVNRDASPEEMKFDAWQGGLDIDFSFSGKVLISAGAYFEWKLFFIGGREEFFKVKDWQVGSMDITGKGRLDVNGGNSFSIDKFDFTAGTPAPERFHYKAGKLDSRNTYGPRTMSGKWIDGDDEGRRSDARAAFAQIVARETAPADPSAAPPAAGTGGPAPADPAAAPGAAPADPAAAPADPAAAGSAGAGAAPTAADPAGFKKQMKALADASRPPAAEGVEIGEPMVGEPPEAA